MLKKQVKAMAVIVYRVSTRISTKGVVGSHLIYCALVIRDGLTFIALCEVAMLVFELLERANERREKQ